MEKKFVRLLKASEIECRVATINEKGLSLLLYKDARVDQRILDETFGPFGWKRNHQSIDGNLYCTVEIYNEKTGEWIAKQDVGTTGFAEKEKSMASDSFKRACFNWGIGRELYSAPFIWISANKVTIQSTGNRFYCKDHFYVSDIGYNDDREINKLVIKNGDGQIVYELMLKEIQKTVRKENQSKVGKGLSDEKMKRLDEELKRTGVDMDAVQHRYHISKPEEMTDELYTRVMVALGKTESTQVA